MDHNGNRDRFAADGGIKFSTEREAGESTTEAVLRAVAAVKGVARTDLDPLYDHVETDALRTLLRHADERDRHVRVEFTIEGLVVLVTGDGVVRIFDESRTAVATSGYR